MKTYTLVECPMCGNAVDVPIEVARIMQYTNEERIEVEFVPQRVVHRCKRP